MSHPDENYIDEVDAVKRREERVLIARRASGQSHAGKWEFPGGKSEEGETFEGSLAREIAEEFGMKIQVGERILEFEYDYERPDGKKHRFFAFWCHVLVGEPFLTVHDEYAWVKVGELPNYDFIEADRQLIKFLV
mgnify:CR=1 FL=1